MAPAAESLTQRLPQRGVGWLRIQSNAMGQPKVVGVSSAASEVARQRSALTNLKKQGWSLVVMVRWGEASWSATRPALAQGNRAPLDLREAFARGRELAELYGDLVDAWEIENEPDIVFFGDNADVFAAYHKALSLGLAAGRGPSPGSTPGEDGSLRLRGPEAGDCGKIKNDELRIKNGGGSEVGAQGAAPALDEGGRLRLRSLEEGTQQIGLKNPKVRTGLARGVWSKERGARSVEHGAWGEGQGAECGAQGAGSTESLNFTFPLNLRTSERARSLVLMAAPGLPPGPHFEQLLDNGYLSYTEGFNFHYYGFAMDFGGVYSQFHDAVVEIKNEELRMKNEGRTHEGSLEAVRRGRRIYAAAVPGFSPSAPSSSLPAPRFLPLFITEWGYSLLDGVEAQTVPGRVAQWRYFTDVATQIAALRVAAPMAFLLRPYYEHGMKEFGLSMPTADARRAHYGFAVEMKKEELRIKNEVVGQTERPRVMDKGWAERGTGILPVGSSESSETVPHSPAHGRDAHATPIHNSELIIPNSVQSGGLSFVPQDFGLDQAAPWMARIGQRVGDAEASPALAWLLEQGARSEELGAGSRSQMTEAGGQRPDTYGEQTGKGTGQGLRTTDDGTTMRRESGEQGAGSLSQMTEAGGQRPDTYGERAGSGRSEAGIHHSKFLIPNSRPWTVQTEAASPVVMDFIAGEGVTPWKAFHGYVLGGMLRHEGAAGQPVRPVREGNGVMVFYNFGAEPATVTVRWPEEIKNDELGMKNEEPAASVAVGDGAGPAIHNSASTFRLSPGVRREVPVTWRTQASEFRPTEARIVAEVDGGGAGRTVSRWASKFYPLPSGFNAAALRRFDFSAEESAGHREFLRNRPLAPEEPALKEDGRWLVTDGVRVEETPTGWRIQIDQLPGVGMRPAVAELPLPAGWRMTEGETLAYDYRLIDGPDAEPLRADDPDPRRRLQTGRAGSLSESYIRTETGNLFSTVPRLSPTMEWQRYTQNAETFTMHFLGRTAPPWRFFEHKPAALVFFVRPDRLPAIYEVRNPVVMTLRAPY